MTENKQWFERTKMGIQTPTSEKKDVPAGLWKKTTKGWVSTCKLQKNNQVDPDSGEHFRMGSTDYFALFFDNEDFLELDKNLESVDPLSFKDKTAYVDRLAKAKSKTQLKDAIRTAVGKSMGADVVIACMDFSFIGGSMGSVVGEKICRAIDHAISKKIPLVIISKSGGARMMEAPYALMQMVRTSAKLTELSEAKLPYVSLCTDPTTGGVTASYAMLGDINIAEPNALIAFAGPRVVQQTMNCNPDELPEGFQRSEYLFKNGFLDFIIDRKYLKKRINLFFDLILNRSVRD